MSYYLIYGYNTPTTGTVIDWRIFDVKQDALDFIYNNKWAPDTNPDWQLNWWSLIQGNIVQQNAFI
jgi:hypothetical protein